MRWCAAAGVTGALLVALVQPAAAEQAVPAQEEVRAAAAAMAPDADYLAQAAPAARAVAAEYGIPASVTAAQSILESGWGASKLAVHHLNYFGFKCTSAGPGPIAVGCAQHPTTECEPECAPTVATFRVYGSMTDSFRDYGRLITTSEHYAAALPHAADPDRFITEVAKKYATDPEYAAKVIALMVQHDLYRLDSAA
ncbi:glucosaminidase domain-containing protein [Actinokineospora sp. NPDC004072]